jgi:hypothetical protein
VAYRLIVFQETVILGAKSAIGLRVPDEVMAALGNGNKPPVKVSLNGYTYRTGVAVMGGEFMVSLSAEKRHIRALHTPYTPFVEK